MTDFLFNLGSLSLVMAALILLLTAADFAFGRRITARARYLLWIVVILRLCLIADFDFLPHLVEIPMNPASETELPPTEESTDSGSVTPADKDLYRLDDEVQTIARPDPVPADSIRVIDPVNILFAVWLTGALLQIVYTAVGYAVTSADLKKHLHSADERMKTILTNAADSMEIGRVPALYVSGEVRSPMLMGIFRPMIVLPDTGMDDNSAAAVLAHELTHLKRRDLIVKLLCVIASSLHWFNPLVWLTQRSCVRYMELSCDEEVLNGKNADVRAAYGSVMLDILRRCSDSRRYVPLTTHFQPGKRRVKERFQQIMDGEPKNSGTILIALTLVLCLAAGAIVGCVKDELPKNDVPWVNLDQVSLEFDGYGQLTSASYTDWRGEELFSDYTNGGVPLFLNGSLVVGGDIAVEYSGVDDYAVDFYALFRAMYDNKSHSVERNPEHSYFKVDEPDVIESVEFVYETGEVFVNGVPKSWISFHTDTPEPNSFIQHVYLSPNECASILQLNMTVIRPNGGVHASFIQSTGETDTAFQYALPGPYLNNEQQIIFWRYPDDAVQLTETEALLKLQEALTEAYENTYGKFEPLTEKPETSPYPGDEIMLRWQIPNLTVTGETDRFYHVEFMGEMLIDKYTGDIYRYYNGLAQFFAKFDPEDPGALMFAG
ncbi:MAG: M56 family metallopeptidase [Clostridia bacterium]|nr:M56 family metallopeptidase [Clostridia bacterium]